MMEILIAPDILQAIRLLRVYKRMFPFHKLAVFLYFIVRIENLRSLASLPLHKTWHPARYYFSSGKKATWLVSRMQN